MQLKYAFKQILLRNQITASPSGNSFLIDKDPAGNIFEIEWNRKKKYEICFNEDEGTGSNTNEEVDNFTIHCLADNEFNLQDNVLYYIGGYNINFFFLQRWAVALAGKACCGNRPNIVMPIQANLLILLIHV